MIEFVIFYSVGFAWQQYESLGDSQNTTNYNSLQFWQDFVMQSSQLNHRTLD